MLKLVAWCALALLVGIGACLITMRLGCWNPSYESVRASQAVPPSEFRTVGEVSLHVRDEGQGPVLLMLHSSMTNLREWDAWANRLKQRYRVIRIDWPPYGLSIDPRPSLGMSGVVELLQKFVADERLERFSFVASSSGATIAVLYTALHPERVSALALSTLPLAAPPPTIVAPLQTAIQWTHDHVVPNYYPRFYYALSLAGLYGDPHRLDPATIDWYYATNNIPGGFGRVRAYYQANTRAVWSRGAAAEAATVAVPVLLQWGDADPVLTMGVAARAKAQFTHAPVTLIHYPSVGHYPMLELPERTGQDLEAFFDRVLEKPAN
jgi:pimeloyl-ACP methyl ester carboxylesterase